MLVFKVYVGNALFAKALRKECGQACGQCVNCLSEKLKQQGNKQTIQVEKGA